MKACPKFWRVMAQTHSISFNSFYTDKQSKPEPGAFHLIKEFLIFWSRAIKIERFIFMPPFKA